MKKAVRIVCLTTIFLFFSNIGFAQENSTEDIAKSMEIQNKISNIGLKILNSNVIEKRMIFVYSQKEAKINTEPGLRKRQIIVYDKYINFAENDDEIAAMLSREICKTAESYSGMLDGRVTSAQVKLAPKKYEIFFDKRAVDFMVKAGYNPLALITYMNKAYPQKRSDKIARTNLTSKRLANIYEYIYTKYPYYLKNNEYLHNESYQNFLLTSFENRQKLAQKIKSGSKKEAKYE